MSVRFHRAQFENMESNHTNMASTLSFNGAIGREEPEQYLNAEMFFDLGSFVFDRKMSSSDKAEIILLKNPAGELVVTKKIHKKHFRKTEVALMKRVSGHERIIGYLGYQHPELGNDHHYIYMEYMRTDLYDFQDDPTFPNRMMPEDVIKTIFKQLVEGVDYLHTNHICHRDLKPENIFLNDATSVKIGDFGYATAFEPQQWFSKRIGTFGYTPPEVVTDMQHNFKVDIWALGVILFTLFNHINPFLLVTPSNSNKRQYSKDVKRNIVLLRYEIAEGRDPPFLAFELIKFMLNPDPNLRPDITNVKGQRWLQASETTV